MTASGGEFAPPRPAHLQWRYIALVAAGGAVGTAVRAAVSLVVGDVGPVPVATLTVNLIGAFVLGALLEALEISGPDRGRRLGARLFLGTGVLGGFTTYSALATATAELAVGGQVGWAAAYALGTVLLGGLASALGIAVGGLVGRRRGVVP